MAEPGLKMVELAKQRGTWTALDEVEAGIVPDDLQAAFELAVPEAWKNWEAFPRSSKRNILEWIFNAKRAPTRAKRIKETVEKAALNKRANHPG